MKRAPLLLLLVFTVGATAHAGDRRLETVFVNMTPDAESSAASRACVKGIEDAIKADYTELVRMNETPLRKLTGMASEPFLEWPDAALARARARQGPRTPVDALILVDCRPDKQQLDALVQPSSEGVVRIHVSAAKLDGKLAGALILRRAWAGFSP